MSTVVLPNRHCFDNQFPTGFDDQLCNQSSTRAVKHSKHPRWLIGYLEENTAEMTVSVIFSAAKSEIIITGSVFSLFMKKTQSPS